MLPPILTEKVRDTFHSIQTSTRSFSLRKCHHLLKILISITPAVGGAKGMLTRLHNYLTYAMDMCVSLLTTLYYEFVA